MKQWITGLLTVLTFTSAGAQSVNINRPFSQKRGWGSTGGKTHKQFRCPVIIDNAPATNLHFNPASIVLARTGVEAIMPFSDTCWLSGSNFLHRQTYSNVPSKKISPNNLGAIVDASQTVSLRYDTSGGLSPGSPAATAHLYAGHPLFIVNLSARSGKLELQDENLVAIQEALDSSNQWRPVQIWLWSWCGNSFSDVVVKPKHFALVKIPCYGGDYFTDLRVKIHLGDTIITSNVYKDRIDYRQFTLPACFKDEKGELGFNLAFLNEHK